MTGRPRESPILKGWVTLRLNFRLKGYVLRQYLWTVKYGNGYILQRCRCKFSQRKRCIALQTLFEWSWIILFKKTKIVFGFTLWGFMDNIRTPSIAPWKAGGRLPICHNWTCFRYLLSGWDVISRNLSKSARFFEGPSHFERKFETEGTSPTNHCCVRKLGWLPFRVVSKYPQCVVWFCHKTRVADRQTDGRTDRQTYRITTAKAPLS